MGSRSISFQRIYGYINIWVHSVANHIRGNSNLTILFSHRLNPPLQPLLTRNRIARTNAPLERVERAIARALSPSTPYSTSSSRLPLLAPGASLLPRIHTPRPANERVPACSRASNPATPSYLDSTPHRTHRMNERADESRARERASFLLFVRLRDAPSPRNARRTDVIATSADSRATSRFVPRLVHLTTRVYFWVRSPPPFCPLASHRSVGGLPWNLFIQNPDPGGLNLNGI
ncbi:hypothetical protein B0H12DRAFT_1079819 [Mycena haematopus]|nr:hypothetical protein B0H12DRAFT_1079819 [Mycena haematopus]